MTTKKLEMESGTIVMKKNKIKIKDPFYSSETTFFKVPLDFQLHMRSMSQSEKDVYICFLIQVYYRKTLEIEMPIDTICYWTGIRSISTAINAVKGLAEKGWIKDIIYQKQKPNIYILNLKPVVNNFLIEKIKSRSENTSKAKKKSIKNGEAGKFEEGNQLAKGEHTET